MGQAPGHRPTGYSLGPTGLTKRILKPDQHTALDHRALRREELAHSGQSQNVQAQEGRQIRVGEGSLRHVKVSQVACVATPNIGGLRSPLTATTHPPPHLGHINKPYLLHPQTRRPLKREEPQILAPTNVSM